MEDQYCSKCEVEAGKPCMYECSNREPTNLETINCPDCWNRIHLCRNEICRVVARDITKILEGADCINLVIDEIKERYDIK